MLDNDIIEPSNSEWNSPCIIVPKSDGSYRFVMDYHKLNVVTKTDTFLIPQITDCINNIGNAWYVSKFGLWKGYWHVPLTDHTKEVSAFVVNDNLYQYKFVSFKMKNSSTTFQRMMYFLLNDLRDCEVYIDAIIYSTTSEVHLKIKEFFVCLEKVKLSVNLHKSNLIKWLLTF